MKKRILVLALALTLVLAFIPAAAAVGAGEFRLSNLAQVDGESEFDWVGQFSEGLAAVRVGDLQTGKYGFIDESGAVVIPIIYDGVRAEADVNKSFFEGAAAVLVGEKWGFIDRSGNEIVPPTYDMADFFSEGLAAVRVGDWETGKWGYVDKSGNVVTPITYDAAAPFSEGLAGVVVERNTGYIDKTGNFVIPPRYQNTSTQLGASYAPKPFSEGLAAVMIWIPGDDEDGLDGTQAWGYIDTSGNTVIPHSFYWAFDFSGGMARVMVHDESIGRWFYIDRAGNPADVISVHLFGHLLEFAVQPMVVNGRTLVPMRTIFEALGTSVEWDGATQTVTATRNRDDTVIKLTIGNTTAEINGQAVTIDQPAIVVDGSTLVPLRFVGEALGVTVDWDAAARSVIIT